MNLTGPGESWQERAAAVTRIVRNGLPQFVGFEVLLRIAALVVLTPLTAWLTARLIGWSGDGAISNHDIAGFLLSAKGLLYLTIVASTAFTFLFFEFGGLAALAIGLQRSETIRLPQLFRLLGASIPCLWRLAVRQFLTCLACAVPSLAATGIAYQVLLTKNDINYYLIAKPPQFWIAVAIASAAALAWSFLAIRIFIDWIHPVPLLVLSKFYFSSWKSAFSCGSDRAVSGTTKYPPPSMPHISNTRALTRQNLNTLPRFVAKDPRL